MTAHRSTECARVLGAVADLITERADGRRFRVGVDGVDGVGKTTFAAELAVALRERGSEVVQVSADRFHQRRELRHRRGRHSPEGFFLDSYDLRALVDDVLVPMGPEGEGRYRPGVHDAATDELLDLPWTPAPPAAVLVVDGLFLQRGELLAHWDLVVFLDAPFEVTVARMAGRDGSHPDPAHPSVRRYVEGQRLYFAACAPREHADVVIDNSDLARPVLRTLTRVQGRAAPTRKSRMS